MHFRGKLLKGFRWPWPYEGGGFGGPWHCDIIEIGTRVGKLFFRKVRDEEKAQRLDGRFLVKRRSL